MYVKTLSVILALGLGLGLDACGDDSGDSVIKPAQDGSQPALGGGGAIGTIEITVTHPEAEPVSYTIGCLGDTFPLTPEVEGVSGQEACTRLGQPAVLDRLIKGAPADQVCTEIYGGPDEATITGEINNETIDTVVKRDNGCAIDDWDNLLAGVLPPARGV